MKVNRYLDTDKVVKKMVDQLVIKVVLDNEEEVVDKVTRSKTPKIFFQIWMLVWLGRTWRESKI